MTKFKVTYVRTLTLEDEIEADTQEEAEEIAQETIDNLKNVDYSDADLEFELEPKFLFECQDCHDAEGLDDNLPYCVKCMLEKHEQEWLIYKVQAEKRMEAEKNRCRRCSRYAYRCTYHVSPTDQIRILCPACSALIAGPVPIAEMEQIETDMIYRRY